MSVKRKARPQGASLRDTFEQLRNRPDLLGVDKVDPAALEAGIKLQRLRSSRGVTQKQLEQRSGISQSAISDIERGVGADGPSYRIISTLVHSLDAKITFEDFEELDLHSIQRSLGLRSHEKGYRLLDWSGEVSQMLFLCEAWLPEGHFSSLLNKIRSVRGHNLAEEYLRHFSTILEIDAGQWTEMSFQAPTMVLNNHSGSLTFAVNDTPKPNKLGYIIFRVGEEVVVKNEGVEPSKVVVSTITPEVKKVVSSS